MAPLLGTLGYVMDDFFFLVYLVCGAVLVMPIIALVLASSAHRRTEALNDELARLREQQARLLLRVEQLETAAQQPHVPAPRSRAACPAPCCGGTRPGSPHARW